MFSSRLEQLQRFRNFLGPKAWKTFVISVLTGALWFLVDLSFVYVMQAFLVSLKLIEPSQAFLPKAMLDVPLIGLFCLVVFGFLRAGLSAARFYLAGMLSQDFSVCQRSRIFERSLNDDHDRSTSEIMALFTDRCGFAGVVVQQMGQIIITCIAAALFTAMGFYYAPMVFLCGLVLFGLCVLPLRKLNKVLEQSGKSLSIEWKAALETLVLGMRNRFLLKLYELNNQESNRGRQNLMKSHHFFWKYYLISAIKNGYPLFVGTTVMAFLTYIGLNYFKTPGIQLITLFYIFLRLAQISAELSSNLNEIRFHWPSFKELYDFNQQPSTKTCDSQSSGNGTMKSLTDLKAIDISFSYQPEIKVFDHLSLSLKKDDILLIKGESGSGKSTLILNLVGALRPDQGKVLINSMDATSLNGQISPHLGYVGPEPYMIPGTIRENLLYGNLRKKISDEEIWQTLRSSQSEEFVLKLPHGLSSGLNEMTQLSTGQKQRLSFARALLREPSLLILDEATANLDPQTESKIIDLIKNISQGRMVIVISHKDTFNHLATQTLMLPQKQIQE